MPSNGAGTYTTLTASHPAAAWPIDSMVRRQRWNASGKVAGLLGGDQNMDPFQVLGAISTVLGIVDQVSNQFERFKKGAPEPPEEPPHRISASRVSADAIVVQEYGREVDRITAQDIQRLDENSQKLIKALEESMQQQYDLWVEVYPKRDQSADPVVNAQVNQRLKGIATNMCRDLDRILRFLDSIGKYLEDHYRHVRFVCDELKAM